MFTRLPYYLSPARLGARLALLALFALFPGCRDNVPAERAREPEPQVYEYGTKVSFGLGGDSERFRVTGWSHTEQANTWTEGAAASLEFRVPESAEPVVLSMKLLGLTQPPELPFQLVEVSVNGEKIATWQVDAEKFHAATIPQKFVAARGTLKVALDLPKAVSPAELKMSADPRRLAVRCSELSLSPASGAVAPERGDARAAAVPADRSYALGTILQFGEGQGAERYQVYGWHPAEKEFAWTEKTSAVLEFGIPAGGAPLSLKARLAGMTKPPELLFQPTEVYANGQKVAEWQVGDTAEFQAVIPAEIAQRKGALAIELRTPGAVSPKSLGVSADSRTLGVRCHEVRIEPARQE